MSSIPDQRHLLRRSRSDRIFGGVCAGLARHFAVDPTLVRVIFVVMALAHGAGVVLYVVLWVLVPEEGVENPPAGAQLVRSGVEDMSRDVKHAADQMRAGAAHRQTAWLGGMLVALGAYLLAVYAGLFNWWDWRFGGPVLLIALGLILLVRRLR